jgi:hypothetical protein
MQSVLLEGNRNRSVRDLAARNYGLLAFWQAQASKVLEIREKDARDARARMEVAEQMELTGSGVCVRTKLAFGGCEGGGAGKGHQVKSSAVNCFPLVDN